MTTIPTNNEAKLKGYSDRIANRLRDIAEAQEDIKEIKFTMLMAECSKIEIDGAVIAAKRKIETPEKAEKRVLRETAKESAHEIAMRLGSFADMPLGKAAIAKAA